MKAESRVKTVNILYQIGPKEFLRVLTEDFSACLFLDMLLNSVRSCYPTTNHVNKESGIADFEPIHILHCPNLSNESKTNSMLTKLI